jgi:hypothetical protein
MAAANPALVGFLDALSVQRGVLGLTYVTFALAIATTGAR